MTPKDKTVKKRPTAWAVARLAGVSQTTVSFVLNNRRDVGIPESTREVVIAAAKQLGYRPNLAARSLVRGKTNAMALWITKLSAVVYFAWAESLQHEVRAHGYELIVSERGGAEFDPHSGYSPAPEWPVDGLFAYGVEEYLRDCPIYVPTVVFGPYPVPGYDYVGFSLRNAVVESLQHLVDGGRKRIAFLQGLRTPTEIPVREERYDAYMQVMQDAGLPINIIRCPHASRAHGYEVMKEYLLHDKSFDALFCHNDDVAIGAMRALKEAGINIPDDVALIGCDGLEETDYHQPRISTISNPFAEIASTAWNFMERRLEDPTTPYQSAVFEARFVKRESSDSSLRKE